MKLADLLEEAGLTGRGGAAFSTAIKLRAASAHGAAVIVNACDGERGATKDAWVVAHHLEDVIEGARLVAGGRRAPIRYAAHRGSATASRLAESGLSVLEVPNRYVSSEETSLISLSHGGLARPMTKRAPFVTGGNDSRGKRIRPTIVINAETAWRISQIEQQGPAWFRSFGTPEEPGPRLVSIGGYTANAVVLETQAGVALASLLDAAGPFTPHADSILVGGLAGTFLSAREARSATWSTSSLSAFSASVGSGVIEVIDPRQCPLEQVVAMLAYAAGESAGQCGPCMFGLPSVAADFASLVAHPNPRTRQRLLGRLGLLPDRGACRFPDGVSRFAASALRIYGSHLDQHRTNFCDRQSSARTSHALHA